MRYINIALMLSTMLLAALPGCERPSPAPPPQAAAEIMSSIKQGFNAGDTVAFCRDFSEIMFTGGFTRAKYLEVSRTLQAALGAWESEVYLGQEQKEGGLAVHSWRAKFQRGRLKLVLVLNPEGKVAGLWFR